jgi:homoserine kinase type II
MSDSRFIGKAELKAVLNHYPIDKLLNLDFNERGYCNTSYALETVVNGKKRRLFLRRYKSTITLDDLSFEHSLISYLAEHNFVEAAYLLRTKDGETNVCLSTEETNHECRYYAIFDYLEGDDSYTWVNPHCSEIEIQNAATLLARFHGLVTGFTPLGHRNEPRIADLLPTIEKNLFFCRNKPKGTKFDQELMSGFDLILTNLTLTLAKLKETAVQEMPETIVHCDFHPGNLKFRGEDVVGLFDFDWSKIDYRCFDVALALWYFFADWTGDKDGEFRVDEANIFYQRYQQEIRNYSVGPINELERRYLPAMISASNFYVLNWTILDYINKEVDAEVYTQFLLHGINFNRLFNPEEIKFTPSMLVHV